jgi:hypothetical protein
VLHLAPVKHHGGSLDFLGTLDGTQGIGTVLYACGSLGVQVNLACDCQSLFSKYDGIFESDFTKSESKIRTKSDFGYISASKIPLI